MTDQDIHDTFEAFFEKYKKTEGDESSWSAFWADHFAGEKFEINLTKCPRGTRFKLFLNSNKLGEIEGWDAFLMALDGLEAVHAPLFDKKRFFESMKEMV